MGRLRLVPAREQPVDQPHAPFGGDDDIGPPIAGVRAPVRARDGLEGARRRGSDRDDGVAGVVGGVDALGRRSRDPVPLGYGGSPTSCELTPVWSVIGANPTPLVTRRVTTSGVNPRAALGISALPGSIPNAVW